MRKTLLLLALLALPIGADSETREPILHPNGEGQSHASCTDHHGITHHADCSPPYRAYCRQPEPGECQCSCVFPIY